MATKRNIPSIGKQSFDYENSQNVSKSMIQAGSEGRSRIIAGLKAYKNTRLSSMYGPHTTTGAKILRAFNLQEAAKWYDRFRAKVSDKDDDEQVEKAVKDVHTQQSKQSAILVATWKRLDTIHGLLGVVSRDVLDIKTMMVASSRTGKIVPKFGGTKESQLATLRKKFEYVDEAEKYKTEDPLTALREDMEEGFDLLGRKIDKMKPDKGFLQTLWDFLKMETLFKVLGVIAAAAAAISTVVAGLAWLSKGMKGAHEKATDKLMTGDAWRTYKETGEKGELHRNIEQSLQAGERDLQQRKDALAAGTGTQAEVDIYQQRLDDRKKWLQTSEGLNDEQKQIAADYIKQREAKNGGIAPADWRRMEQSLIDECSASVKSGKMTRAEANDYLGLWDAYKAKAIAGEISNPSVEGFKAWAASQKAVTPDTPPVKAPALEPPKPAPITNEPKRHWWQGKPKPAPNPQTSGRGSIGRAGTPVNPEVKEILGTLKKKPAPPGTLFPRTGMSAAEWDIYRNTLASIESEGAGGYQAIGGAGNHYDGRYQLGKAAKTDAARILGIPDPGHTPAAREAFRNDPELQEAMFAAYTVANHQYMNSSELYRNLPHNKKIEALGYAHNQGHAKAKQWLKTGKVGKDAFGTKGTRYSEALSQNLAEQGGPTMANSYQPTPTISGSMVDQQTRSLQAANQSPSSSAPSSVIVGPRVNNTTISQNARRKGDRADVVSKDNSLTRTAMKDVKHPVMI